MIVSPLSNKPSRWLALSFGIALSCSASLFAADLTWDGNVTSNWDTVTNNWSDGNLTTWTDGDDATFGATGVGTITLAEDIVAGNLTFDAAGYTISTTNGNLTLNNGIIANESATINGANPIILGANNTWQVADSKTLTIETGVDGPHGFTKAGTGKITLSTNASTYTGETLVEAGILEIRANNVSSGFTISDGARLIIATTAGNFLGNTADVHVEEGGVFEMNKNETMGGLSGSGNLEYNTSGTFFLEVGFGNKTTTFSGDILQVNSGTLNFIKDGTGNLTLSGNNNYTGTTTIEKGILEVDSADVGTTSGALGVGGNIRFSGGTLRYTANSASTDYSSRIKNSGSAIILNTNGNNVILAGNIDSSNTRGLTKLGTGNLTLSGNNTYSGSTTISEGTLIVDNGAAIADTERVNLANVAGATFQLNAAETIGSLSGGGAVGGIVDLQTNTLTVGDATDTEFKGTITGSGNLTKTGSGRLTLFASGTVDTYTGNTIVQNGTLALQRDNASSSYTIHDGAKLIAEGFAGNFIGDTSDIQVNGGGTLEVNKNETMGGLSGSGDLIFNNTDAFTFQVGFGNETTTFSGNISHTGSGVMGFTKVGTGNLTLSGTNTYNGTTTINDGTLILDGGAAIADTSAVVLADAAGAILQLSANETIGSLAGGGATGGTVDLQSRTLTVGDGTNKSFYGTIIGTGGLTKIGSGTFTLRGESFYTYTGDTLVEEGKLTLREDTETSSFTIRNGATLEFAGIAGDFIANTSDIQIDAGGTVILSKSETMGSLTGAGDFIMRSNSDRTLSVNPGSADTVFSGNMSETLAGKLNFTKNGTGTLTLSGTNTTTGKITVNAGTLQFGKQVSLFNGNTSLWTTDTLDIRNGTTAAFNVGGVGEFTSTDIATLSALGTAGGGFRSGSTIGLDTTNASGGVFTYSNVIANPNGGSNNLGLNKLGTGTLELTEANTYTRGTTVTAGTLLANNPTGSATGTGAVTVKLGATLGGNGSITGPTTIESGGLHTAGTTSSASTLTHGDVTYEKGATVTWNLLSNSTSMDFDQFNTGALNFSTTNDDDIFITLDFSGTVNFHDDFWRDGVTNENEWKIWDYSSLGSTFGDTEFVLSLTGSASGLPVDASAFEIWDNNYDGNDAGIWLRQTSAVPEPSTYALMSLGLAAFGWHVRRRRKSAAGLTTKKR